MGFLIKDVLELDLLKDASVLAGKAGINNEVVWVNMMEILDEFGSLQRGELLLTTGYGLDNMELHSELIRKLHELGLSGIAIQPGYYIDEVPDYIIKAGDKYSFPVIKVPKKITFSHITRTILKNIQTDEINSEVESSRNVLIKYINNSHIGNEDKILINNIMKASTGSFMAVVQISHFENGIVNKFDINSIMDTICSHLGKMSNGIITENISSKEVLLFSLDESFIDKNIATELSSLISKLSKSYNSLRITVGLSNPFYKVEDLQNAYNEAQASLNMLIKISARRGVITFKNIGFLQILDLKGSRELAVKFMSETLQPLVEYDRIHASNYLDTLKLFLANNHNINVAAEQLFIHRHTLRYRLEKITELCHISLDDYMAMLKYSIALLLHDLLV